ncbi:acetoin dehydrogenase dihydrolipoyllysine-residue acetyltransferase subunit [Solirhodobacter olei]|uniref:acetoin dehydrogenase dihydrolipoyllysine-residue acetyltransferase subunit n=1 Tax=Solirhodobacter olei TaxID=2493082 RepID=UPI000FD7AA99|nr:acetoin dehydrogenase dihydrolipoyllysine-residue acetyltransferase subunit [Solirhodobacter olei]
MATPIRVDSAGGEYMENVVILEWAVGLGSSVTAGETLVTVETAKAATDIDAPVDGYLTAIFAEPGAEVPLSAVLGLIGVTAGDTAFDGELDEASASDEERSETIHPQPERVAPDPSTSEDRIVASPAARRQAARLGLDLRRLGASSPSGRIKLRDLPAQGTLVESRPVAALPVDDNGPLSVYRSGRESGVPILLIHGFGADAVSWSPIERELARQAPVIRLDLPNHGQSPHRRVGRFANLARDITKAFDDLCVEDVHLVGHSLGGASALALADVRPRRVASLTLIAPGGLGPRIDGEFIEGLARASCPDSLGPWLRHMVCDPKMIGDDFVRAAMASRMDAGLRAAQLQMARDLFPDATQGFDLRAALERLECPTRLIWGRSDAILPWQHALAAPGRVGLHLFEATGHAPQLERTDAVLAILRAQIALSGVRA